MKKLTEKQKRVLEFIMEFVRSKGHPPTIREIGSAFKIASPYGVQRHLMALEKKGYIERDAGKARGMRLTKRMGEIDGIPLIGNVAAGTPITAIENVESYYSLNSIFGNPDNLFLLRVKGESMINAGINDGDLGIVRQQPKVENGEIGVAIVNDEATVKRIYLKSNIIKLEPENPEFSVAQYELKLHDVRIAGKVIGAIRVV